MITATYCVFYLGIALYLGAAALGLAFLKTEREALASAGLWVVLTGAACLLTTLVLRLAQFGLIPLTTDADTLNLLILLATFVAIGTLRDTRQRAVLAFSLPPLGAIAAVSGWRGWTDLGAEPTHYPQLMLVVHVGLAFLAYALFLIASLMSLAYAVQASRIKQRQTTGIFRQLPSLERLDASLYRLIQVGYPLFAATLMLGFLWAWYSPDRLAVYWWLSPKMVISFATVVLYAVSFHGRARGLLRGPKLAYVVFTGFTLLLAVYLILEVTDLTTYNFWGHPQ